MPAEQQRFEHGGEEFCVHYRPSRGSGFEMWVDDDAPSTVHLVDHVPGSTASAVIETDGLREPWSVTRADGRILVQGSAGAVELVEVDRFPDLGAADVAGAQVAPMPGRVLSVHVAQGDTVDAGQTLVIMEAMKMEHTVVAPAAGVVTELRCAEGDQVDNGQVLVVVEEAEQV